MRIGIDVYGLSRFKFFTGISNYIYNILKYLEIFDQENEYFLYNDTDINFTLNNPRWHKKVSRDLFGGIHTLWLNTILVGQLLRDNIDIFWQPNGALLPIYMPKNIKVIVTIHDLVSHYYPETMEFANRSVSRIFFYSSFRRADAIIAVSNSTANNIKDLLADVIDGKKMVVIYEGISNEKFRPIDKERSKHFVKEKFDIDNDYILFVGTIEPRKNLLSLIKAFSLLVKNGKNLDYQLIIAGKKGWGNSNIHNLLKQFNLSKKHVKFLGYVDAEDLVYLYSGAEVFILPSLYEGFGLPILEAMACGCPVITSNISSMPEVSGGAALLVNPSNTQEIAEAIYRVVINSSLREKMNKEGFKNVARFSWDKTAKETLNLIHIL
ncbi:MAG: glycosyltransferase family 1 protein [Atribacterota bacterium]|nr:glycosyltransferase family 1 protein [Atribacterota bacterium]